MKNTLLFLFTISMFLISCDSKPKEKKEERPVARVIKPIPIDIKSISGLDLKPVTNQDDPERRLFQKRVLRGLDLSVYVVSSETKAATHASYGIDEFLYLLNGRARLNPVNGEEVIYNTGDFFIAPKGFNGEWETQGGDEFLIELSVITTKRAEESIDPNKTLPYLIDKAKLSGIGISPIEHANGNSYHDLLYEGAELSVELLAEKPDSTIAISQPLQEQFNYVVSGAVKIQPEGGEVFTFYRGDFFLLPKGFRGTLKTMGHGLFRYMRVTKSKNMARN